jgi:hypothetical protein
MPAEEAIQPRRSVAVRWVIALCLVFVVLAVMFGWSLFQPIVVPLGRFEFWMGTAPWSGEFTQPRIGLDVTSNGWSFVLPLPRPIHFYQVYWIGFPGR